MATIKSGEECNCPIHGKIKASFCVICKAQERKDRIDQGLIANKLKEGRGPDPDDPKRLQIRYRALLERKHRSGDQRR